jgi:hypothetical protein
VYSALECGGIPTVFDLTMHAATRWTSPLEAVEVATVVHLVAEFAGGVDVRAIPAADVVLIVKELAAIGLAIEEIPEGSAVWRSLRAAPLALTLEKWSIQYLVDEKRDRLLVLSVTAR